MSKAVEENRLTVTIKILFEISIYIENLCVQTRILVRTKRTYLLLPFTPVTVFLIAEKLLSL